jgi:hypothetical protein
MTVMDVVDGDVTEEDVVRVYRGANHDAVHDRMFFSTSRHEAESYGAVKVYDLPMGRMFDSLDRETIEELLPLYDPWDDGEIETFEQYLEKDADTWSTIEGILSSMGSYDVLKITEGGVVNYLVMRAGWVPEPIIEALAPGMTPRKP